MTSKRYLRYLVWFVYALAARATAQDEITEDTVLATIDGQPAVTVGDVVYQLEKRPAAAGIAPVAPEEIARLVDDLVTAKVLVIEAEAAGYGAVIDIQIKKYISSKLREKMRAELGRDVTFTEEDIVNFYHTDSKWRKYADIRCKNEKEAKAARQALADGEPWDKVWEKYSIEKETFPDPGTRPTPLFYDGREASRAVYETPVGSFTPAVPDNDGIRWHVFRVDKIVHGRIDTPEEARPGIESALRNLKIIARAESLTAELRKKVRITRDAKMWKELNQKPFAEFRGAWGAPGKTVADVGGIPVYGEDFVNLIDDYLFMSDEDKDHYRARDPGDFAYVADCILKKLEDEALLEYAARERGWHKDPAFVRTVGNYRAEVLTDLFFVNDFVAKLPPLDDAAVKTYYDAHPELFTIPESVDIYIIALPDENKVRDFFARVRNGEDIIAVGEAYNQQRGRELMDMYETPPRLPPEKEDFVRGLTIYHSPNPAELPIPLTEDLRNRVFHKTDVGYLTDVFQLADGRWAFYKVTNYQPPGKEDLAAPGTFENAKRLAFRDYVRSKEVDLKSKEWISNLKAKHDIKTHDSLFAATAAFVQTR